MKAFHGDPAINSAHLRVAMASVRIVENYFKERGFQVFDVGNPSANGQDLTVAKGGRSYRVEVKTASLSKRCMRVKPVRGYRRSDDWIAIVINDSVIVQPMKDHLACCSKDGTRYVTDLEHLLACGAI